jgi:hypothetical protein
MSGTSAAAVAYYAACPDDYKVITCTGSWVKMWGYGTDGQPDRVLLDYGGLGKLSRLTFEVKQYLCRDAQGHTTVENAHANRLQTSRGGITAALLSRH